MRDFSLGLVSPSMKTLLSALLFSLIATTMVSAGPSQVTTPRFVVADGSPSVEIKNLRIDPRDGKVRGTAYLAFGYSAPMLAHVHIYGLDSSGRTIAEGCDKLSRQLLYPHPRLPGRGRDTFSANLGHFADIKTVKIVAHTGHDNDCKMDDNRLIRLF